MHIEILGIIILWSLVAKTNKGSSIIQYFEFIIANQKVRRENG
jgi:hypothetical protein